MAFASCDPSYSKVFPEKLLSDIEHGNYGYDYCLDLEEKVIKKLGR